MAVSISVARRTLLTTASAIVLTTPVLGRETAFQKKRARARPLPARYVTLQPAPFTEAIAANRRYILSLRPRRLLHNFYLSAGLPAPEPVYGGWESLSIAGHTLGHWMSACALLFSNQGDADVGLALDLALKEMATIQARHGDGYLCGTTVQRDGISVDGKIIFEEIRRGEIKRDGLDLNGGWVPIYTYHKILAGLIDAYRLAAKSAALPIASRMADYFGRIVEGLTAEQLQLVLRIEHGGIEESYAELFALTANPRWLKIAERLKHDAVIDPLIAQIDELSDLHANTQIPKIIGIARLYETTGETRYADAARFFFERVTKHHSYVIGGNSEREHFGPPDRLAGRLGIATCEACNSYNMLKLSRHLYSWQPHASWFDYYERTQLNHILAHQRPDTGDFVYFMPLEAGAKRDYSTPENSFWCCVGSGMESHAKHSDSIFWEADGTLFINLFIPSRLQQPSGLSLDIDTAYPFDGKMVITITKAPRLRSKLAIRIPQWAERPTLHINTIAHPIQLKDGYAMLDRHWKAGDRVELQLPFSLRLEALPGEESTVAFLSGPLVLAADLGPAATSFDGIPPVLVASDPSVVGDVRQTEAMEYEFTSAGNRTVKLKPFYPMYDRRAAVYLETFTPQRWETEKDSYLAREKARADSACRTVDVFHPGEMQPERDHEFQASGGGPGEFYGRNNRLVPAGEKMSFKMKRRRSPSVLRLEFWGQDIDRVFSIFVDGTRVATETLTGPAISDWRSVDYRIPGAAGDSSLVMLAAIRGNLKIYQASIIQIDEACPDSRLISD